MPLFVLCPLVRPPLAPCVGCLPTCFSLCPVCPAPARPAPILSPAPAPAPAAPQTPPGKPLVLSVCPSPRFVAFVRLAAAVTSSGTEAAVHEACAPPPSRTLPCVVIRHASEPSFAQSRSLPLARVRVLIDSVRCVCSGMMTSRSRSRPDFAILFPSSAPCAPSLVSIVLLCFVQLGRFRCADLLHLQRQIHWPRRRAVLRFAFSLRCLLPLLLAFEHFSRHLRPCSTDLSRLLSISLYPASSFWFAQRVLPARQNRSPDRLRARPAPPAAGRRTRRLCAASAPQVRTPLRP